MSTPPIAFPSLPPSLLAALLDATGQPSGLSIRPSLGDPTPIDVHQRVALHANDMTTDPRVDAPLQFTPVFHNALVTLRAPTTVVDIRMWGGIDTAHTTVFLGDRRIGGASCSDWIDGGYQVTAPIEAADVVDYVAPFLGSISDDAPAELDAHLDADTLRVLGALLDGGGPPRSIGGLHHHLQRQGPELDRSELADVIGVVVRDLTPISRARIESAVTRLDDIDFVQRASEGVALADPLARLAEAMLPVSAGLRWQRRSRVQTDDGPLDLSADLTLVMGPDGVTLLLTRTALGWAHATVVTSAQAADVLAKDLTSMSAPELIAAELS